jgi:chromosome segregation ATPase
MDSLPLSSEQCRGELELLQMQVKHLKWEARECRKVIDCNVKGRIRSSKKRITEIGREIDTLRAKMWPYYNGGIV